jgi:glycosyltransferase involved in cell wall biosynthesis
MARKLVALLDDAELRGRMGAAGLERVKTALAWEHEVPRLLAAYEELFKCDTSR